MNAKYAPNEVVFSKKHPGKNYNVVFDINKDKDIRPLRNDATLGKSGELWKLSHLWETLSFMTSTPSFMTSEQYVYLPQVGELKYTVTSIAAGERMAAEKRILFSLTLLHERKPVSFPSPEKCFTGHYVTTFGTPSKKCCPYFAHLADRDKRT